MKKVLLLVIVFGLCLVAFNSRLQANDRIGKVNIGLNYPGLSFRYGIGDRIALEIKGQLDSDITVVGPRVYYYFGNSGGGLDIFAGLENDVIFFKGDESKGTGLAQEIFVGAEYFINKELSLSGDLGPALILLSDNDTYKSDLTFQIIANVSVNYYFGNNSVQAKNKPKVSSPPGENSNNFKKGKKVLKGRVFKIQEEDTYYILNVAFKRRKLPTTSGKVMREGKTLKNIQLSLQPTGRNSYGFLFQANIDKTNEVFNIESGDIVIIKY